MKQNMALKILAVIFFCIGGVNAARADALYKGGATGHKDGGKELGQQQAAKKTGEGTQEALNVIINNPETDNPQCESGGQECAQSAIEARSRSAKPLNE